MVSVPYWQPKAWSRGLQPFCIVAHSSHELGELSQCFKNDDSTIKIILVLVLVAVYTRCNLDFGEIVCISERHKVCCSYTPCPQKTCDYIFYNNFNNRCPITVIFGIVSQCVIE